MDVKQSRNSNSTITNTGATFGVTVRWVDTSAARRAAKRLSVDERTVTRGSREAAWRYVRACVRKAQTSDHVALVEVTVTRDAEAVWAWQPTAC